MLVRIMFFLIKKTSTDVGAGYVLSWERDASVSVLFLVFYPLASVSPHVRISGLGTDISFMHAGIQHEALAKDEHCQPEKSLQATDRRIQ